MTVLIPEAVGVVGEGAEAAGLTRGVANKAAPPRPRAVKSAPQRVSETVPRPPQSKASTYGKRAAGKAGAHTKASVKAGLELPKFPLSGPSGSAHKIVVAEFVVCVILIGMSPVMTRDSKGGKVYAAEDFVRLTAVCLLFFVLALLANTPRASRVAAAFGALVTLGVVYNARQSVVTVTNIFTHAAANKGNVSLATPGTGKFTVPTVPSSYQVGDVSGNQAQNTAAPTILNASQGGSSSGGGLWA